MKITKLFKVEVEKPVDNDILCNSCGESCVKERLDEGTPDVLLLCEGLIEATVSGGYHSTVLGDMTEYRFSLCENCLKDMFDKFKLPVELTEF